MARRNLLAEAQVTAAAEVAPQVAALSEALRQARTDRNSAIRAASAANAGIAHAIHLAGSSVKQGYTGAQALAAPGQSYSGGAYGAAAGNERSLGTTALASSLGNALKELSDRRISAAGGRAYATARALSDYEGKVAGVQTKQQGLAAQQGLLTGSTLSKLTEAQAGRDFQASQQARSQSFQGEQNRLSRKNSRLVARQGQQFQAGQQEDQQSFTAGQSAADRKFKKGQNAADRAAAQAQKAAKPPSDRAFKGRSDIQTVAGIYKQEIGKGRKLRDIANDARGSKKGYAPAVIDAAADLATKGFISPIGVTKLEAIGVTVPKQWTGVTVRPHTRRRRSK